MRDFPPPTEYAKMLSTPEGIRLAFRDAALKAARVELDAQQMPRVRSGAFAVVYKLTLPDGRSQAVRLFLKDGDDRRERYALIHEHLARSSLPSLVSFTYAEDAFRAANGKRYPMMTMDWVEGETLFDWLHDRATRGDTRGIAAVAVKWREVVTGLKRANIAHGDLQHANVMVTTAGELKLVDYDGMCVPKLVGRRNLEIGVEPYQHPGRDGDTPLSLSLDNFSSLVLQTCLSALAADPGLWGEFVVKAVNEKILFRREDFDAPANSRLFQRLRRSADPQVQKLATVIAELWKKRLDQVPALEEVLGTFDFGQVRSALDKKDYDAAVGMLERSGKLEADAPADLRPKIHDAIQRTAKLNELLRAVDAGNESAMPALAASPLLRDYPAAAAALAVARDASIVAPIINRLDAALKSRRGRDLVREWDLAQAMLTRPTGTVRRSASRFVGEVRQWRERNAACDRVMACLRRTPPDENGLAVAWRDLLARGGHPECDPERGRIESIIRAAAVVAQPTKVPTVGTASVQPPSAPAGSRPVSGSGSRPGISSAGRAPVGAHVGTVPAAVPQRRSGASSGSASSGPMSVPASVTTASGGKLGGESRLGTTFRDFARELGRAAHGLACRWIPPVRWVSDRTPWHRLDRLAGAMTTQLACGAFSGGLLGVLVGQGAANALRLAQPIYAGSIEWRFWRGAMILLAVAFTVSGVAIGIAIARNRLLQRPAWRLREAGRSIAAAAGGGLVAGCLGAAMAMSAHETVSLAGGPETSWSFCAGWLLVALAAAAAVSWFSFRAVPNVSRLGLALVGSFASCLATIVLRFVAVASGTLDWIPLTVAAASGAGVFGAGLAVLEAVSAHPYLFIAWQGGRQQRLNLGTTPVVAGGDAGRCDIVAPGQLALALRYWIDAGQLYVLDYATGQPALIGVGDRRPIGTLVLMVEAARLGSAGAAPPTSGSLPAWVSGGSRPASGGLPAAGGARLAGPPSSGSRGSAGSPPGHSSHLPPRPRGGAASTP